MVADTTPLSALPIAVTLATVAVSLLVFFWRRRHRTDAEDIGSFEMPAHQEFTLSSLAEYDGKHKPLCLGICGKVVDCSSSENINHGQGYGALWAGKDATYAMATVSLKPEHANFFDFKLEDFDAAQQKALAGWYKHFTTKYPVVGTLKEYEGWDFSKVEKDAESETPFGAGAKTAGDGDTAGATDKSVQEVDAAAVTAPDLAGGTMLAAGDRVTIQGIQSQPELNGTQGVLQTFVAEKGRFAVKLDGKDVVQLFKPGNLTKSSALDC